jgi:hypothetical protein
MRECCEQYKVHEIATIRDTTYTYEVHGRPMKVLYCPECGSCLKPPEADGVYCSECRFSNWDRLTGVVECDHPENCDPDWWSPTGLHYEKPEDINFVRQCKWYEPK